MDYVFTFEPKVDLNDIEKDVAIKNVKRIENALEAVTNRFESSPNFRVLCYENDWVNHPDEYYVKPGVFKNVFKNFFGDITLSHFLSEYSFDEFDTFKNLVNFRKTCALLYSDFSYDEVECAYNQILQLNARLESL